MTHYRHRQVGWLTVSILLVLSVPILAAAALAGAQAALIVAVVPAIVLVLVFLSFAFMTVSIDGETLVVKMGIGLVSRRIPLADIMSYAAVTNPWHYGWGVRVVPNGRLYNVSGFGAVELVLRTGGVVRVGTDEPGALVAALRSALGVAPSASGVETRPAGIGSKLFLLIPIIVTPTIVGLIVYSGMQSPHVQVTEKALIVEGMYSADVPFGEIRAVTLETSLPPTLTKTNGFAMGGVEKGYFDVERLGAGQLFVNRRHAPFVLVTTASSFVVVNFSDPAMTRALHADLVKATNQRR